VGLCLRCAHLQCCAAPAAGHMVLSRYSPIRGKEGAARRSGSISACIYSTERQGGCAPLGNLLTRVQRWGGEMGCGGVEGEPAFMRITMPSLCMAPAVPAARTHACTALCAAASPSLLCCPVQSLDDVVNWRIACDNHCFGCTAGSGSGCGGQA